jgi:hypothetical protein
MSSHKPLAEKTTEDGTTVRIESNLPTKQDIKEKVGASFPPSNATIENELETAKSTLEEQKSNKGVDEKGKVLIEDMQKLIDTTQKGLQQKNKDEVLQKLYADSKEAADKNVPLVKEQGEKIKEKVKETGRDAASEARDVANRGEPQEIKEDATQLYKYIKNLTWSFIRSADFRELASDWISFIQFLTTKKVKEEARKKQTEGGATSNVAKAIEQGLETPSTPEDDAEELQRRSEQMFTDLIDRIRNKPEYEEAFRDIFRLLDSLKTKFEALTEDVKDDLQKEKKKVEKEADSDPLYNALDDAEALLNNFVGKDQFTRFKETIIGAYKSVRNDKDVRSWFYDLRNFLEMIWDNPNALTDEQYKEKAKELTTTGRQVLQKDKWSNLLDDITAQFRTMLENIKNDSTTREFGERLKKLGVDFAFNKQGYPDLYVMEDSVIQVKNMLIPLLKDQLANINVGRIEFFNKDYDVRLEDLGFSGSFLPEHIDFSLRNDSHLNTKDSSRDIMRHSLVFQVDKIKPEFRNFKFYYKRKSFPKIEDYGVADMRLAGDGGLIRINWRIDAKAGSKPVATLVGVTVHIDKIDIHVVGEKTKHDVLDRLLLPFLQGAIRNKVQHSIESYLKSKLTHLNEQLNSFLQSSPIDSAKEKANQMLQNASQKVQSSIQSSN